MLNRAKVRDSRFHKRWADSGAYGRLHILPKPSDIDTTKHFWESFGNMLTENSAGWVVRLCQTFNSWRPFTLEELQKLYDEVHDHEFDFNELDVLGYIDLGTDGRYRVTATFVSMCYHASPARSSLPAQCQAPRR